MTGVDGWLRPRRAKRGGGIASLDEHGLLEHDAASKVFSPTVAKERRAHESDLSTLGTC